MEKFTKSKSFTRIIYGLGIFIVILAIFQAGIFVGTRKAEFSGRFGDNYHRIFEDRRLGGQMGMGMMPNPHGATGKIVKIDLPTFVIASSDNTEKIIRVDNHTLIRHFQDELTTKHLVLDTNVVVLGAPNENGEIEARLIRILPPVSATSTSK